MKLPNPALVINGARALFWITLVITFVLAVLPPAHTIELFPWDKAEHFIAFYVLSCMAIAAYPRVPILVTGLWLALFGSAIELVQALPFVDRDCDILDWVADVTGIACAFAPTLIAQWRTSFSR